eukprot:Rmarinus@m.27048
MTSKRHFIERIDNEESSNVDTHSTKASPKNALTLLRSAIIGEGTPFITPFGVRRLVYCDYTASGRAVSFIEDYIRDQVLPNYANTHTSASQTGLQTSLFRHEARSYVKRCVNGYRKDKVIFVGSGATGAIHKLIMCLRLHRGSDGSGWGGPLDEQPIVLVGAYEHHSNLTPWRESVAKVIMVSEDPTRGGVNIKHLSHLLKQYSNGRRQMIGSFSAASNLTGILEDVNSISILLHRHGALAFFDYAAAGPYVDIDMNPVISGPDRELAYKDAIFISPHKFVGGVSSPGVLVVKKDLLRTPMPSMGGGGGAVFFVTHDDHRFLKNVEEREEAGTPAIVGSVRSALAFQLKAAIGTEYIRKRDEEIVQKAMFSWGNNPNIVILGNPTATRLPIFSLMFRNGKQFLHYAYVVSLLNDAFGIQCRGGCSCAGPYGQKILGISPELAKEYENALVKDDHNEALRPGFVRLSFHYSLPDALVDFVLIAVDLVAAYGPKMLSQYKFRPVTGEWLHRKHEKVFERRWLAELNLTGDTPTWTSNRRTGGKGDAEWVSAKGATQTPGKPLTPDECIHSFMVMSSMADDQASGTAAGSHTESLEEAFPADVERLRWFPLPSEGSVAPTRIAPFDPARPVPDPSLASFLEEAAAKDGQSPSSSVDTKSPPPASVDTHAAQPPQPEGEGEGEGGAPDSTCPSGPGSNPQQPASTHVPETADAAVASGVLSPDAPPAPGPSVSKAASAVTADATKKKKKKAPRGLNPLVCVPPASFRRSVVRALVEFDMIRDGDRLLIGLSGGKDSLSLLHTLLFLQRRSPNRFEISAATVDPQTPQFDPSPLKQYLKDLGVPYYFLSQPIIAAAETCMKGDSICSFCSRMKRGALYSCAQENNCNVLVLGQHLDDLAESFLMSVFHNGRLRTMKANYDVPGKGLRLIRPLVYVRERETKKFADQCRLPIIDDNCPACYTAPMERQRMKTLLKAQEQQFPNLFSSLSNAMRPLVMKDIEAWGYDSSNELAAQRRAANKSHTSTHRLKRSSSQKARIDDGIDDDDDAGADVGGGADIGGGADAAAAVADAGSGSSSGGRGPISSSSVGNRSSGRGSCSEGCGADHVGGGGGDSEDLSAGVAGSVFVTAAANIEAKHAALEELSRVARHVSETVKREEWVAGCTEADTGCTGRTGPEDRPIDAADPVNSTMPLSRGDIRASGADGDEPDAISSVVEEAGASRVRLDLS